MTDNKWEEARADLDRRADFWLKVISVLEGVASWLCVTYVLVIVMLFPLSLIFSPESPETAKLGLMITAFMLGAVFWPGSLIVRRHIHAIKRWFRK